MPDTPLQLGLFEEAVPTAPEESDHDADDGYMAWSIIHRYTRAEALADGTLIDISETASEAGIIYPVAVTAEVWRLIEQIPNAYHWEDVNGRLWDVVWMLRCAIKVPRGYEQLINREDIVVREHPDEIHYKVILHHHETRRSDGELVLKARIGPGDDGEPVMTVMTLDES
jgi:hypothetical protein